MARPESALIPLDLPVYRGGEKVPAGGWYLCKLHLGQKPVVFYNSAGRTEWRDGARLVQVDTFAGPVPESLQPSGGQA